MKYVKNTKRLATAVITTVLTLFCFVVLLVKPEQTQFLTTGIILIPIMANTWQGVFFAEGEKPTKGKVLHITNIVFDIGCFLTIVLYTLLKNDIFLWLALGCSLLLCASIAATVFVNIKSQNK